MATLSNGLTYKEAAEAFVSNQTGTPIIVLTALSAAIPIILSTSIIVNQFLHTYLTSNGSVAATFLLNYFLLVFPLLVLFTYVAHYNIILEYLIFLISLSTILFFLIRSKTTSRNNKIPTNAADNKGHLFYLTYFRITLLLCTVISILAVDFPIFPRYFCKAENFGLGLMDLGVGSYISSHALTSQHAKINANNAQNSTNKGNNTSHKGNTELRSFYALLLNLSPLLLLGFLRLFTIKSSSYQEHVTEYGIHWNFYFTLAFIAALSTLSTKKVSNQSCLSYSVAVLAVYQYCLLHTDLTEFILRSDRVKYGLFSANREGIISLIGYSAVYFISVVIGSHLRRDSIQNYSSNSTKSFNYPYQLLRYLLGMVLSFMFLLGSLLSSIYIQEYSRRLFNLAYFLAVLAYILFLLSSLALCQLFFRYFEFLPQFLADFPLISALNRNSLAVFLLANLLTGAVNLAWQTIFIENWQAFMILAGYSFCVSAFAFALHSYDLTVKLMR
jgi:phosphatidylinositol glycan class W